MRPASSAQRSTSVRGTCLPLLERRPGRTASFFLVFGSVALFAYVLHVYAVHALAIVLRLATGQSLAGQFDEMRVSVLQPKLLEGSGLPAAGFYASWIGIVLLLYPLCRWYVALRRRRDWWLSYP